jgi:Domain of unknown function (DUF4190)
MRATRAIPDNSILQEGLMTAQPPNYPPRGGYGYLPDQGGYGYQPVAGTNGMAIASFVCSLVGYSCGVGLILGVIFGFVALSQIKRSGQNGRGMAIAGIIIGAVPIVIILGILIVAAIATALGHH